MEKHQHPRPFLSHRTLRFVLTNCLVAFIAAGTSLGAPAALRAGAPLAPDKSLARQVALDPVITKSVSQATANIGDVLTFTLTVSNPLPFAVVYFGPVDSVSPTLSILSGTPGYVITGTTIGWNPASGSPAPLASLATATYTFTAQVKDCGDILNAASFTWRRDGTNQGNVVDSNVVGVKVNCAPQFVATKEVNQVTAAISNTIQWTIRVTNTGSLTGTYFGPVDNLPANVTFQSATPGYIGPNPLIWNTSGTALGPGATDVYTIAVHVDGPCGKPIENRAFIKTQDAAGTTNATVATNPVVTDVPCQGTPKIELFKEVSAATAQISNTLVYTLKVVNSGGAPGSYFGPYDSLPLANVTLQSATPGGVGAIAWNTATPKPIAAGATDVYTAAVHVDGPCGATFFNRAFAEVPPYPVANSNAVSTTVECPTGWKVATPGWIHPGGIVTYYIALENAGDTARQMSWADGQLSVNPNLNTPWGVAVGDLDGDGSVRFETPRLPVAYAAVITGPCKPPYMCDFVNAGESPVSAVAGTRAAAVAIGPCKPPYLCDFVAQPTTNVALPTASASGVSWSGSVPAKTRLYWPVPIQIPITPGKTPPCGKAIKNTVVITNADGTVSTGVAQARVMCPDLGDAPDSSNHFGNPMRMDPFGGPSPLARYPSVYQGSAAGDEGPIHYLAGASSNLTTGLPSNAIDSALGYRLVQNVANSLVSNERDADQTPDQDPLWQRPNLRPAPVITNARSNRDGYDNALTNPATGSPLAFVVNPCSTGVVRYAQYLNPATAYTGTRYVNLWVDWNMDGDWADTFTTQCGGLSTPITNSEWVAQNVLANPATGVYQLPLFLVGNMQIPKRLWVRISIADAPAPAASVGNGPAAGYLFGETEDHLLCFKALTTANKGVWVDCPMPVINVINSLPDSSVLPNRYFTHSVTLDNVEVGSPVTVTWKVSAQKPTYDLKANKPTLAQGAQRVQGADGTNPITEVVTDGASSVQIAYLEPGTYVVTAQIETADGETDTESITVDAAYLGTYLPLVRR